SALVGLGFLIMLSSIWVATITGLLAFRHFWIMVFWIIGTWFSGISTPKSPRATITASVTFKIESKFLTASGFSILATIKGFWKFFGTCLSISWRRLRTSWAVRTKDSAT